MQSVPLWPEDGLGWLVDGTDLDGMSFDDLVADDWLGPSVPPLSDFPEDFVIGTLSAFNSKNGLSGHHHEKLMPEHAAARSSGLRGSFSMNDLTVLQQPQLPSSTAWNQKLVSIKPKLEPVPEGVPSAGGPLNLMPLTSCDATAASPAVAAAGAQHSLLQQQPNSTVRPLVPLHGAGMSVLASQQQGLLHSTHQDSSSMDMNDLDSVSSGSMPSSGAHAQQHNQLHQGNGLIRIKSEAAAAAAFGDLRRPSFNSDLANTSGAASPLLQPLDGPSWQTSGGPMLYPAMPMSGPSSATYTTVGGWDLDQQLAQQLAQQVVQQQQLQQQQQSAGGLPGSAAGAGAGSKGGGWPLRKSQSAVELCSWRDVGELQAAMPALHGIDEQLMRIQKCRDKKAGRRSFERAGKHVVGRKAVGAAAAPLLLRTRTAGRSGRGDDVFPTSPSEDKDTMPRSPLHQHLQQQQHELDPIEAALARSGSWASPAASTPRTASEGGPGSPAFAQAQSPQQYQQQQQPLAGAGGVFMGAMPHGMMPSPGMLQHHARPAPASLWQQQLQQQQQQRQPVTLGAFCLQSMRGTGKAQAAPYTHPGSNPSGNSGAMGGMSAAPAGMHGYGSGVSLNAATAAAAASPGSGVKPAVPRTGSYGTLPAMIPPSSSMQPGMGYGLPPPYMGIAPGQTIFSGATLNMHARQPGAGSGAGVGPGIGGTGGW